MTPPDFITGLSAVSDRYDAILCDVWGVLHDGRRAFAGASDALTRFREAGKPVVLITNAPVPKDRVTRLFAPLGVRQTAWDDCVSSGDAARAELARRPGARVWCFGTDEGFEHDRYLFEGLDLTFVNGPEADLVLCIGLRDPVNDHPDAYTSELAEIADHGLPMICANPDIQVRVGDRLLWCAGALARIYEAQGGAVIYPGKPHPAIYRAAREALTRLGTDPARARILAIGDGPATDLKGARDEGYDSLYVGTGLQLHGAGDFRSETGSMLREHGVPATYAMAALQW